MFISTYKNLTSRLIYHLLIFLGIVNIYTPIRPLKFYTCRIKSESLLGKSF